MKMVSTTLFTTLGFCFVVSCFASNCGNRIPVADYFQFGYDMSEFDIYGCPEIGGKRAKIAQYDKCDEGKTYTAPFEPKIEYDVPDAFSSVDYAHATRISSGHVYSNFKDFMEDHVKDRISRASYGRIHGIGKSMFTNGEFYTDMQRRFAKDSSVASTFQSTTFLHLTASYHRIANYSTPEFRSDVEALPLHFNGSENQFLDFVNKYGTHWIEYGHFGGIINRMKVIPRENASNEVDINWEMRKDFPLLNDTIHVMCEKKDGPFRVQIVHSEERDFVQYMIGGWADYDLFKGRGYGNKLSENPVLVSAEVKAISKLIEDKDKKEGVDEAIKVHMAHAYLRSVVTNVQILLDSGHTARNETSVLMNKYEQSKNVHNINELKQLANDFDRESNYLKKH